MNLCTAKWVQCDKNPVHRTVRTAHLSVLMTVRTKGSKGQCFVENSTPQTSSKLYTICFSTAISPLF